MKLRINNKLMDYHYDENEKVFYNLWKAKILPFFLLCVCGWKAIYNRFSFRDNMLKLRILIENSLYVMCKCRYENVSNLFFKCTKFIVI